MSCVHRWTPSERQPAFAGAVSECCDAAVVLVAGAVEHHAVDTGGPGPLGDELADALGLGGLVTVERAQVGLHGGRRHERLADEVVDDLHGDVLRGARAHEPWSLRRAGDLLATPDLAPRPRRCAVARVLVGLECDGHHLPAFPTLRRTCSPA